METRATSGNRRRRMVWLVAVLAPLVAVGVARVIVLGEVDAQRSRVARIKSELPPLEERIAEVRQLRPMIGDVLARKQIIEALAAARIPVANALADLSKLPPQIALRSVRGEGRRLVLEGDAASTEDLAAMLRQLAASPLLEAPKVVSTHKNAERGAQGFRVEARMKTVVETQLK
jgi:type IV pilus assembly protein PilN